jgi:hypothetical protein
VIGNGGGCLNDDESLALLLLIGPVENESATPNTKTSSINDAIGDVGPRRIIISDMAANNVKSSNNQAARGTVKMKSQK